MQIVCVTYWQSIAVGALVEFNVLTAQSNVTFSHSDAAASVQVTGSSMSVLSKRKSHQNFLICLECLVFSISLWFAWPHDEVYLALSAHDLEVFLSSSVFSLKPFFCSMANDCVHARH